MPKVTFEREQITVDCNAGENLLAVAEKSGVDVFRGMWPNLHCRGWSGWCKRCKVWVLTDTQGAVNAPTSSERSKLSLNGALQGSMRLACQVTVQGDVRVQTRSGGPEVPANPNWTATDEPTLWKERWARRHEAKGATEEEPEAE